MSVGEVLSQLREPFGELFGQVYFVYFATTLPYWGPPLLLWLFIYLWFFYVQMYFASERDWIMLEVKLPKDIMKSPKAMEVVLNVFHQPPRGTWFNRLWKGQLRAWFSLEIVSIGGNIKFFIRTHSFFREMIESQIYSQYPEVQIETVEDYTRYVSYLDPGSPWDFYGLEWKLDKPDPYPIKTYIDYELDKERREAREHVDPITPIIELMGSLRGSEQLWFQFVIRATDKKFGRTGWFKRNDWKDEGRDLIRKLTKRDIKGPATEQLSFAEQSLSPGERHVVEAIERSISKYGFDVGIRTVYLAKKEDFRPISFVGMFIVMKQFSSADLNGFKHMKKTDWDYPWEDFRGHRLRIRKRSMFRAYVRRWFFYPPYRRPYMVLSAEELATIYHFPGAVSETPTFERTTSRRAGPPPNLPT